MACPAPALRLKLAPMKARDIFGLVLRCAALWVAVWGAWQMAAAIVYLPATVHSFLGGDHPQIGSIAYFAYGFPGFLGGLLVLRFANAIVWFTYRE